MNGIIAEMLDYRRETMVEWMRLISDLAWRQREVPDKWMKAIIVPLHKGKNSKDDCNNYLVCQEKCVGEFWRRDL